MKLISLLFLLSLRALAAEPCRDVDLRDSYHFGPAQNQGNLGWCFAYTMSDLIGFELKRKVAPFDIAISLYKTRPEYGLKEAKLVSQIGGGNPGLVFKAVQEVGICPAAKVSSSGLESALNLPKIEKLAKKVSLFRGSPQEIRQQTNLLFTKNAQIIRSVFPTSSMDEIVDALMEQSADQPLISLVDNICGERKDISSWTSEGGKFATPAIAAKKIRTQLNRGKPILLGYNADTLRDITKTGGVNHASTIIGMRTTAKGSCEYLLRNSWGDVRRDVYDLSLRKNFEGGHVWIPHDVLVKTASWVIWIDRH